MERLTLALVVLSFTTILSTDSIQNDKKSSSVLPWRQDQGKNLVCYYVMPKEVQPLPIPEDLNATLCTHVIYIAVGTKNLTPGPFSAAEESFINMSIPVMKKINPKVKIMLCHGGGFDEVLVSEYARSRFVTNTVALLRSYNFDGLDLDWEFPQGEQIKNVSMIVKNFHDAFRTEAAKSGRPKLLFSAAVACSPVITNMYDIPPLAQYLDFLNLMGYDFNGFHPPVSFTAFNGPLFRWKFDREINRNVNWSAYEWVKEGVAKEKLMIGLPTFVHAYKLLFDWLHGVRAPADGKGDADKQSFPVVCEAFEKYNATRVWDDSCKVPYAYYGNQWISYDDEESVTFKTKYTISNGFGGVMVFAFNHDDYAGHCKGNVKFPLLSAIHKAMFG